MGFFSKNKFGIWSFLVSNIAYIYIKYIFYHNIRQNLHIWVLILCFIFDIRLPIYKHVFFNPKQSPIILYLSIILESLKKDIVYDIHKVLCHIVTFIKGYIEAVWCLLDITFIKVFVTLWYSSRVMFHCNVYLENAMPHKFIKFNHDSLNSMTI